MCGRFVQSASAQALALLTAQLGLSAAAADAGSVAPRYNLAPTQPALAVLPPAAEPAGVTPALGTLTFGLRRGETGQVINARAETLAQRPMFAGLLRRHRCLVLATGFYEWHTEAGGKTPYLFARQDGAPFVFAALHNRRPAGPPERACAAGGFVIVTTAANDVVAPMHGRMPVMLEAAAARAWLDPTLPVPEALTFLRPYGGAMRAHAVSRAVNNPRHDAPDCVAPA